MNSWISILAIYLVFYLSEACFTTPPPNTTPPAPTTPTPKTTPTTTSSTTTMKYECPIGGKTSKGVTCVNGDPINILSIEPNIADPEACSKFI